MRIFIFQKNFIPEALALGILHNLLKNNLLFLLFFYNIIKNYAKIDIKIR